MAEGASAADTAPTKVAPTRGESAAQVASRGGRGPGCFPRRENPCRSLSSPRADLVVLREEQSFAKHSRFSCCTFFARDNSCTKTPEARAPIDLPPPTAAGRAVCPPPTTPVARCRGRGGGALVARATPLSLSVLSPRRRAPPLPLTIAGSVAMPVAVAVFPCGGKASPSFAHLTFPRSFGPRHSSPSAATSGSVFG